MAASVNLPEQATSLGTPLINDPSSSSLPAVLLDLAGIHVQHTVLLGHDARPLILHKGHRVLAAINRTTQED